MRCFLLFVKCQNKVVSFGNWWFSSRIIKIRKTFACYLNLLRNFCCKMSKRKVEEFDLEYVDGEPQTQQAKLEDRSAKKHTLDSDEEDSGDDEAYNIMHENDIEGEEDGVAGMEGDVKITPFNMKEELEEGHFDKEGHYQWDKTKEIRDNWLDNIDWVKVKTDKNYIEKTNRGLADSSDSEDDINDGKRFNEIHAYKQIFEMMQPRETINKTLQRLGKKSAKLSSAERWRRKKAGIVDEEAELITKLTALTNDILTNMGNMDVYEETYEMIERKIKKDNIKNKKPKKSVDDELDMYADDFDTKEKDKLVHEKDDDTKERESSARDEEEKEEESQSSNELQWEFKWKQEDTEVYGPYPTEQMQQWVSEGYFNKGVFVRKIDQDTQFYSSSRIDFELYL